MLTYFINRAGKGLSASRRPGESQRDTVEAHPRRSHIGSKESRLGAGKSRSQVRNALVGSGLGALE
jgi:hypothetical protein